MLFPDITLSISVENIKRALWVVEVANSKPGNEFQIILHE